MFGLFGGDKKEEISRPIENLISGGYFATQPVSDEPKLGAIMNMKGVLFLKGEQEFIISQNKATTGRGGEIIIDRNTGLVQEKIESNGGLIRVYSQEETTGL